MMRYLGLSSNKAAWKCNCEGTVYANPGENPVCPACSPQDDKRPCWTDYFLGLAMVVSRRSHDSQTQHGCLLVNSKNHIVAIGYNGFPRGMDDSKLPNVRPDKYPWMDHSEVNALANTTSSLHDMDITAYVTGPPCFPCLKALWRHDVRKVIHTNGYGYQGDDDKEEISLKRRLLEDTGMSVVAVKPDLSWLVDMVLEDKGLCLLLDSMRGPSC